MSPSLLLCTDLDRTLLPNGAQPESARARPLFKKLAARPDVVLAYVSGRNQGLIQEAVAEYELPLPDYVVADVGSSIYAVGESGWQLSEHWAQALAAEWHGLETDALHRLLEDLPGLRLQEASSQTRFKLSYYAPPEAAGGVVAEARARLAAKNLRAELIWSVDETTGTGLLDIVPANASKRFAVEFLRRELGLGYDRTLFAGDSGNDLQVMASPIPSVLVANATEQVRAGAREAAQIHGYPVYLAQGGYLGMNGCYSAGILEGVAHYHPPLGAWLEQN